MCAQETSWGECVDFQRTNSPMFTQLTTRTSFGARVLCSSSVIFWETGLTVQASTMRALQGHSLIHLTQFTQTWQIIRSGWPHFHSQFAFHSNQGAIKFRLMLHMSVTENWKTSSRTSIASIHTLFHSQLASHLWHSQNLPQSMRLWFWKTKILVLLRTSVYSCLFSMELLTIKGCALITLRYHYSMKAL